jgi:hypothetical protein
MGKTRHVLKGISAVFLFFSVLAIFSASCSEAVSDDVQILLIKPSEGAQTIGNKAYIRCSIAVPYTHIVVVLDNTDISDILDVTENGFEFRSFEILPHGEHNLIVALNTPQGELKKEFAFTTRHSRPFEEAYSANDVSVLYESAISKDKDVTGTPGHRVFVNLGTTNKIKEKGFELSLDGNIRYFDQNLPVIRPERKGLDLVNATVRGKYTVGDLRLFAEAGDVQMNETPYTVQALARKGGTLAFEYKDLSLRTFLVKSNQVFGYRNIGFAFDSDSESILGIAADMKFLSGKAQVGTVYVTGGEKGSSFGIFTAGGNRKGGVMGSYLRTDFFDRALMAEAEFDYSKFDPDSSDEFRAQGDKAYHIKIGGNKSIFNYEAIYEYIGPDYAVVGNAGLRKDVEGLALRTGAMKGPHSGMLAFSRYNDNVEDKMLFPRMVTYQGVADYNFNGIKNIIIGVGYLKNVLESTKEPASFFSQKMDTDTINARIGYSKLPWNIGLQGMYSTQDDGLNDQNDTTTTTLMLVSAYMREMISITPTLAFNRSKRKFTDINTDTYTGTLDVRGMALNRRLTYEIAGTYNRMDSSDGMMKMDTINANSRIAYILAKQLWGFISPSVGLRGTYIRNEDHLSGRSSNEYLILLTLSTNIKFAI